MEDSTSGTQPLKPALSGYFFLSVLKICGGMLFHIDEIYQFI